MTHYVSHTFEGRAGEKEEISFNSSSFPPDLEHASRTLCCFLPSSPRKSALLQPLMILLQEIGPDNPVWRLQRSAAAAACSRDSVDALLRIQTKALQQRFLPHHRKIIDHNRRRRNTAGFMQQSGYRKSFLGSVCPEQRAYNHR